MIRGFVFLWAGVTALVFVWTFILSKQDKSYSKKYLQKIALSFAVALFLIVPFFFLNNISGV